MIHLIGLGHAIITIGATRLTSASETLFAAALLFVSEAGRPLNRLRVLDLLWPNGSSHNANHCLRQTVYRLNACGAALRSDRGHIVLPARSAQSDCAELLAAGDAVDPDRVAELVQGPFLAGYSPHFSAPFSDWLERQRDVVTAGLRRALVSAIGAKRERSDWAAVERLATRCLLLDPLNEEATLAIAEAAALNGSKVRALEILDSYLSELGPNAGDIRLPASLLRHRIAETYRRDPPNRRTAPQVGREEEMRELARIFRALRAPRGDTCLIWGEEGIGKTRLTEEFARASQLEGAKVIRVECQPHDAQRPLSAFADMVPHLRALRGAIAVAESSSRYLDLLHDHESSSTANVVAGEGADALLANIHWALLDLIDAVANEQLLILIFEDVHWLDQTSWEFIRPLTQWVSKRQVLLLFTSRRSEIEPQLLGEDVLRPASLHLKPLEDTAGHQLVRSVVDGTDREGNDTFADWCVLHAGGNPYYLTELARHAECTGQRFTAPISLERLVNHRLENLSNADIRVLQAAAVLGRASSTDRIEELLGTERLSLIASFDDLSMAGMIDVHENVVAVRHHLIASAAVCRLSTAAHQLLHRRAAELLDVARATDASAALLWECADHWQCAGERQHALELLTSCARHLTDIGMPCEAARMHERAAEVAAASLEKVHHLTSSAHAYFLGASWGEVLRASAVLEGLRRRTPLRVSEHDDAELELSLAKWRLGHDRRELLNESVRCSAATDASNAHRLHAATWALMLADNLCDERVAVDVLKAVSLALQSPTKDDLAVAGFQMVYHCAFGDPARAIRAARHLVRALRTLPESGHKAKQLSHAAAVLRSCGGPLAEARKAAMAALQIAEHLGITAYAAPAANQLLMTSLAAGDTVRASEWFHKACKLTEGTADTAGRSTMLSNGAEIAIREGRLDEAERLIEESERIVDRVPSSRSEVRYVSFRWRLALLRSCAEPNDHEVRSFLQLHKRTRKASGQDAPAVTLVKLLLLRGRRGEAAKVLSDYLVKYRRPGPVVDVDLAQLASEL